MKAFIAIGIPIYIAIMLALDLTGVYDVSWWWVAFAVVVYWALPSLLMALWFFVLIFLCWLITLGSDE